MSVSGVPQVSAVDLADTAASSRRWTTPAGVTVSRTVVAAGSARLTRAQLETAVDERRGMVLFRGHETAVGYVDPPVEVTARGDRIALRALNDRGRLLLPALAAALEPVLAEQRAEPDGVSGTLPARPEVFAEEDRTAHAGVFTALRALLRAMASPHDALLGLYGAFGYDLVFQMDPIELSLPRRPGDRDLVLHLPDEIVEFDFVRDEARRHIYEFAVDGRATDGLPRATEAVPFVPGAPSEPRDHGPGEYAAVVRRARESFKSGELFEVVPGQVFRRGCAQPPSGLFRRLREVNPAPHNLLAGLGEGEHLIGASPEMFVRVSRADPRDGGGADARLVVESSPISGTIRRGGDALEDAERVRELLDSDKEESELTMCTDVDRNDKARVCVPGSVGVTGRRQIEMYSTLIHTVDRVRGVLAPGRDALDGFLAHLWAVTVTGAPKLAAVEFIERVERSPRRWYGGAAGRLGFDGGLETVLTLRTIHVHDGVATVRAGATLLYDSSPEGEEAETELKAQALLQVLDAPSRTGRAVHPQRRRSGERLRIIMVDHRDSFAHCLADYLRQTGARVSTYRAGSHLAVLERESPDLLVLSPGPGRPEDFGMKATLAQAERLGLPVFGVCLGLQGLVEYYGGRLDVLDVPVHGKPSRVRVTDASSRLFAGLPRAFEAGRYHSLHADPAHMPAELAVTARTDDGVVMAVEHRELPIAAVQFHPESIMTAAGGAGRLLVDNAVASLARRRANPLVGARESTGRTG